MSKEQPRYHLGRLKQRYFMLKFFEIALVAAGIGLLAYFVVDELAFTKLAKFFAVFFVACLVLIPLFFQNRLHQLNNKDFTQFLNKNFPQLKESADLLLLEDEELTGLQQLQKLKTIKQFNLIYPEVKLPHHILRAAMIFVGCATVSFVLASFSSPTNPFKAESAELTDAQRDTSTVFILSHSISLSPPVYTNKPRFNSSSFDLTFPEGSSVLWSLTFSKEPESITLFLSGKDSTNLKPEKNCSIQKEIFESGFYQFRWKDKKKIHRSDYFKLDAIKDELPKVAIQNLNQFTKVKFNELKPIEVKSALADDYGLTDALIVATVSKGSGESVKFREEKLFFTSPQKISGKHLTATRSLDLKKLGLEPGDEIYFYVQAWDNKTPVSNHNRTETFFIAVQDTATEITSADSGLGVDLMPEYFRSQRQIIIDTEKLLRDKKRMAKKEFNARSNELGYDQKVLRLRYGQFLGEEDESGIGQEAAHHNEEEKDVTKQFGHQHDSQNEHNLVPQKKEEHQETKKPNENEDPIKDFAHQHDNTEESTFFIQSIKAKLKAAVTIMWDAELHLRLYEPEKSLPYQYKALNLLKEISNDSRIYVHRSGFEAPPLKEEKRLAGDLSEIKTKSSSYRTPVENKYPNIQQVLLLVEQLLETDKIIITPRIQSTFNKAGQELSVLAIENPGSLLKTLSFLKILGDGQIKAGQVHLALLHIRKSLWQIFPTAVNSPNQRSTTAHKLDQEFLKKLESTNE